MTTRTGHHAGGASERGQAHSHTNTHMRRHIHIHTQTRRPCRFPPALVRTARRLPVEALGEHVLLAHTNETPHCTLVSTLARNTAPFPSSFIHHSIHASTHLRTPFNPSTPSLSPLLHLPFAHYGPQAHPLAFSLPLTLSLAPLLPLLLSLLRSHFHSSSSRLTTALSQSRSRSLPRARTRHEQVAGVGKHQMKHSKP